MAVNVAAIVLAGGSGTRVRADINKVYLPIQNRDMLVYSLETVDRSPRITRVVLVVRDGDAAAAERLIAEALPSKLTHVTIGGASRHQSELAGLEAIAGEIDSGEVDIVAIHDGARPFATLDLLERVVDTAAEVGGAVPGLPIAEPLYRVEQSRASLLPRSSLRRVQTPQAFRARELLDSYRAAAADGFEGVDTAETVERYGRLAVAVVGGEARNIKVTFVEDFFQAEEYALEWEKGAWVPPRS